MAEVLLFHHAQGLTPGVAAFADELRAAGHIVHTPDLFDGRTFDSIDEGMAFIEGAGMDDGQRARRPHRRRPARRARVCRLLVRRDGRAAARPDAARRPRGTALLLVHPDQRRVGVRAVAGGRAGPDPRRRRRPDTSSARATSTPPARSSSRSRTRSSSCTPATSTTSPTARSRRTTRTRPRCSPARACVPGPRLTRSGGASGASTGA